MLLRAPTADDAASLFEIYGDPQTNLYNPNGPYPSLEFARQRLDSWMDDWQRDGFGQWALALRDAPSTVIGFGGLAFTDYGGEMRLNLGYRFAPSAWGKGLASEMGHAARDLAFRNLKAAAIYARVRPANLPSIRVLDRLGFNYLELLSDIPGRPPSLVYTLKQEACNAKPA
ncbi:GNAT family N-acetyltransferase [Chromobacterium sphagni]|uniref:GNAT family N-acetyltransferase n=1 Tax=Chromobacterium sphagni TaxID=1903179 RepID=UPI001F4D5B75|nr:GNAT family N-acetyltransferase [Chromobacterium sphagni]